MKQFHSIFLLIICLSTGWAKASAQAGAETLVQPSTPEPYPLDITVTKTTSLVFPATIQSVDRGTKDILVQKMRGVENILQLKAAKAGFVQTNLTVITTDGRLHSFLVSYSPDPTHLTFDFRSGCNAEEVSTTGKEHSDALPLQLSGVKMHENELQTYAQKLLPARRCIRAIHYSHHKIRFSINGIYIKEDVLFYQLSMQNRSNIPYDIGFIRFYIRDEQQAKRTANQEVEIKPLLLYGNSKRVEGKQVNHWIVALEKFTIPDAKKLVIELQEKGGGRHARLRVANRHLVKARLIQ